MCQKHLWYMASSVSASAFISKFAFIFLNIIFLLWSPHNRQSRMLYMATEMGLPSCHKMPAKSDRNSLRPIDPNIRQYNRTPLAQKMARFLLGANHQWFFIVDWAHWNNFQWRLNQNKAILIVGNENGGLFVRVPMCYKFPLSAILFSFILENILSAMHVDWDPPHLCLVACYILHLRIPLPCRDW